MIEKDYLYQLRSSPPFDDEDYGDEDQNTLMQLINQYKEGDYTMDKCAADKVNELIKEIEEYEQVIADANGAMASAERELNGVLMDMEADNM